MIRDVKNGKIELDNQSVYYISFGRGKKNLIIIPGVGDGFKQVKGLALPFSVMYKKFSKDYKVYVFSRRNNLPKNFTTEDMAGDIISYMDYLKIKKADVIGVSQGGMIAQYLAINAPKKVNKLILVVTCARPNDILKNNSKLWLDMAKNKDYTGIMVDSAEKSYVGNYLVHTRRMCKLVCKLSKNVTFDRFITEVNSCMMHDTYNKLDKIKCKTLIIGADKDKMLGVDGSIELNKKIKNSELYIYNEYSHGVYEQAKDFNDRVLKFLRK